MHTHSASRDWLESFDTIGLATVVAQLGWYPIDNLKLSVGHSHVGTHAAQFGAEWGFSVGDRTTMASVYVSGSVNEDGDASVLGGLRLYFAQRDKTLIRRHREDDPTSIINTTQWIPIICEPGVTGPWCS